MATTYSEEFLLTMSLTVILIGGVVAIFFSAITGIALGFFGLAVAIING